MHELSMVFPYLLEAEITSVVRPLAETILDLDGAFEVVSVVTVGLYDSPLKDLFPTEDARPLFASRSV